MSTLLQVTGIDRVLANLQSTGKQIQFATAQAVNDTAKDVQNLALGTLLPGAFTLRARGQPWQKPGGKFGFNIRPFATPATGTATVGSQADWLKEQEEGGIKQRVGGRLAIPVNIKSTKAELLRRELKPRALLAGASASASHRSASAEHGRLSQEISGLRSREAMARSSTRKNVRGLAKEIRGRRHQAEAQLRRAARILRKSATASNQAGRVASALSVNKPWIYKGDKMPKGIYIRGEGKNRGPVILLYVFKSAASIKGVLHFEKRGVAMALRNFSTHFEQRFARALATAR